MWTATENDFLVSRLRVRGLASCKRRISRSVSTETKMTDQIYASIQGKTNKLTKAFIVGKLLCRPRGASLGDITAVTGWHGRKMTPSYAVKQAKRYRYYMNRDRQPGTPAVWRVPAHDLEQLVVGRLCRHLVEERKVDGESSLGAHDDAERQNVSRASVLMDGSEIERTDIIQALVERIDVRRDCVELTLRSVGEEPTQTLAAAAALIRSGRQTRLVPPGVQTTNVQAWDEGLIRLVANAHAARLAVAEGGDQPVDVISEEHGFTAHYFAQLVRLGGLAPDIVTAILEGRQPANLTRTRIARTKALPLDWNEQRRLFGFA